MAEQQVSDPTKIDHTNVYPYFEDANSDSDDDQRHLVGDRRAASFSRSSLKSYTTIDE